MSTVQQSTLSLPLCEVAIENILDLSPEEFTNSRRNGIGASDTSVILGLQSKWKNVDDLILEKLQVGYSETEAEVSRKPAVRKGRDLEELVLAKAAKYLQEPLIKPTDMYRLIAQPWLTINFDGVTQNLRPVEAKVVTPYGDKYYDFQRANVDLQEEPNPLKIKRSIVEHCEEMARCVGIPSYYYAQLQQQLMGLGADRGVLAALRDKDWTLYIFQVGRDEWLINQIIIETYKVWQRIERSKQRDRY